VAQLLDAVVEPACACYLDEGVHGVGVVIDYVDKSGRQSCGLAE
jgi:hypothetical protein